VGCNIFSDEHLSFPLPCYYFFQNEESHCNLGLDLDL
jgi:hypothetical protein